MIQLKDVLHLYLGVQCLMDDGKIGKMTGYSATDIDGDMMIMYTINYGGEDEDWAVYNDDINHHRIKPILRHVFNMTEEEKAMHRKMLPNGENMNLWFHTQAKEAAAYIIHLIKQGFDLFGLIESNQAIDSTLITNHK